MYNAFVAKHIVIIKTCVLKGMIIKGMIIEGMIIIGMMIKRGEGSTMLLQLTSRNPHVVEKCN